MTSVKTYFKQESFFKAYPDNLALGNGPNREHNWISDITLTNDTAPKTLAYNWI